MEKKPPSKLAHVTADTPINALSMQFHREVQQSEDDNVGVESAHKLEEAAEGGGRLIQSAHRSHQLKPYREATRAEHQLEKANVNALQKKAQTETPQSNPYSKWQQKQAIKKQYAAAKSGKTTENATKTAEAATKAAKKAGDKELANELSQKAKQLTVKAEQEMTAWVRTAQNKNGVSFFQE